MRAATALVIALLWGPYSAGAGEMPAWVEDALAWGAKQKRVDFASAGNPLLLRYSTPYLRVAMAANEARRQGRVLERSSVPDDLMAPELHVFAGMLPFGSNGRLGGMAAATAVTLAMSGERVKPSRLETIAVPRSMGEPGGEMQQFEGRELKAVFPLSSPSPADLKATVEYSWVDDAGKEKHTERSYKLDLKRGSKD